MGGPRVSRIRSLSILALAVVLVGSQVSFVAAQNERSTPSGRTYFLPSEDAPVETEFDEKDTEVLFYARRNGVPIPRSIEIANWMEDAAPFLTALPTLADIYANARLVHGGSADAPGLPAGEVRVEVRVTDSGDPRLVDLRGEIERLSAGPGGIDVVVKDVPRTRGELEAIAAASLSRISDPSSMEIVYDFDNGEVTLRSIDPDQDEGRWAGACADASGGSLDGGRKIRFDNDSLSGCQQEVACTTGFPMRFAATYGITTAGHCIDDTPGVGANYPANASGFVLDQTNRDSDMYQIWQPTLLHASANAFWRDGPGNGVNDDDVAYLRRVSANVTYPGRVWKWSTGEWRNITGYESTYALEGMTVCASASQASQNGAGNYCGMVIDDVTNYLGNHTGFQRWTEVDYEQGAFHQGISGGLGSSGGTIYYGGQVYGLQSHLSNCSEAFCPGTPSRYYRANEAYLTMWSLNQDVEFICWHSVYCDPS